MWKSGPRRFLISLTRATWRGRHWYQDSPHWRCFHLNLCWCSPILDIQVHSIKVIFIPGLDQGLGKVTSLVNTVMGCQLWSYSKWHLACWYDERWRTGPHPALSWHSPPDTHVNVTHVTHVTQVTHVNVTHVTHVRWRHMLCHSQGDT